MIRNKYRHIACGCVTTIPDGAAEQYHRDPVFASERFFQSPNFKEGTWCVGCRKHFSPYVGDECQFVWCDNDQPIFPKPEEPQAQPQAQPQAAEQSEPTTVN